MTTPPRDWNIPPPDTTDPAPALDVAELRRELQTRLEAAESRIPKPDEAESGTAPSMPRVLAEPVFVLNTEVRIILALLNELERARAALKVIADPLTAMKARAEAEGAKLSGMAYAISQDPEHLKSIARSALAGKEPPK